MRIASWRFGILAQGRTFRGDRFRVGHGRGRGLRFEEQAAMLAVGNMKMIVGRSTAVADRSCSCLGRHMRMAAQNMRVVASLMTRTWRLRREA
jgi:hypothetical protein